MTFEPQYPSRDQSDYIELRHAKRGHAAAWLKAIRRQAEHCRDLTWAAADADERLDPTAAGEYGEEMANLQTLLRRVAESCDSLIVLCGGAEVGVRDE